MVENDMEGFGQFLAFRHLIKKKKKKKEEE